MTRLFALSDPHLSFARPKPMDKFGPAWTDHPARMARAWRAVVADDDVVLVGGDISWAMRAGKAQPDVDFLASLPGRKILGKGNHDYWWPESEPKRRAMERPGLTLLHRDPVVVGDVAVAGTRLWDFPDCPWPLPAGAAPSRADDAGEDAAASMRPGAADPEVVRARELQRLREALARLADTDAAVRVCLLHYPPVGASGAPTEVTALIDAFPVDWCVFGHIHGAYTPRPAGARCRIGRTEYILTSVDQVDFAPVALRL